VPDAPRIIDELVERTPGAIAQIQKSLPKGFPEKVAEAVLTGLGKAARSLEVNRP